MYYDPSFAQYLQQLRAVIENQQKKVTELEEVIRTMESDLEKIKKEPRMSVGRVEYKFDQLKIEQLDGTLNIGLTPKNGEELMDDFSVNGEDINDPDVEMGQNIAIKNRITTAMNQYLRDGIFDDIRAIEQRLQYHLTEAYEKFIIDDIRKQLSDRVNYFIRQIPPEQWEKEPEQSERLVIERMRADIIKAIENFINNLKMGGDSQ